MLNRFESDPPIQSCHAPFLATPSPSAMLVRSGWMRLIAGKWYGRLGGRDSCGVHVAGDTLALYRRQSLLPPLPSQQLVAPKQPALAVAWGGTGRDGRC